MSDDKPRRGPRSSKVERLQLPPHSIEAEQSVLGALMLDPAAWTKVADSIGADWFFRADHRLIFDAIADLKANHSAIDAVTIADSLDKRGKLVDAGGLSYIGSIARDTPTAANVLQYAAILRERARLRTLNSIADEIASRALSNASSTEIAADIRSRLERLETDGGVLRREPIDWPRLSGEPPPRRWWIQDWLSTTPTLLAGSGGAGKSNLSQAIATALAVNRTYLEAANAPDLRILVWNCEDDESEVWRRQSAINVYFGVKMIDLEDRLYVVSRVGLENTLYQLSLGTPGFTPTFERLREQVNDLGIDVLVVDNISQVYGGTNDQHQVTQFVNAFAGLARGRPFAPILIGHVARNEGSEFSGAAAWENAVRMRWYLGKALPDQKSDDDDAGADPDVVYLARRKANYTNKDYRRLRFKSGVFVPDQPDAGALQLSFAMRNESADAVVLAAFPKLIAAGTQPSDKPQSADYLPKLIIAHGHHQAHTKADLAKSMNRLMGSGRLRRVEIGKYSNRSPRYGLAIV